MNHVVLARKYRPRTFSDMVGQEVVVTALTHALRQQRLHHAYLFTGTRGIGKTTVSRILAKSLNCTGADGTGDITDEPCGVCSACTQIDQDRYIDYVELDAASNRSIDEVRDLLERAAYRPGVGRFKVFMIDEAHQLTKDAFNALLKTLEEPPPYLKFVLATTDPEKMLPTVLSRCLQFNLRPIAPEVIAARLEAVLQAESVPHDAVGLRLLAKAGRGSLRDALSLTDQAIAYGGGQVAGEGVRAMLGQGSEALCRSLLVALARRDGAGVLTLCDQLRDSGHSAGGALDSLVDQLAAIATELAAAGTLRADPDRQALLPLLPAWPAADCHLLYSLLLQGRAELGLAPDEHAGFVMLLLRFLAFAGPAPDGAMALVSEDGESPGTAPTAAVSAPPKIAAAPAAKPLLAPRQSVAARPVVPVASPAATAGDGDDLPPWLDADDAIEVVVEPPLASTAAVRAASELVDSSETEINLTSEPPRGGLVEDHDEAPTAAMARWLNAVQALTRQQAITALARELALQGQCTGVDPANAVTASETPTVWTLLVERESLAQPGLAHKLAEALARVEPGTHRVEVRVGPVSDSAALRELAARRRRQAAAVQTIEGDPVVQSLLATFPGSRIVPGSIRPR